MKILTPYDIHLTNGTVSFLGNRRRKYTVIGITVDSITIQYTWASVEFTWCNGMYRCYNSMLVVDNEYNIFIKYIGP